ncbi:hypothetical protein MACH26_18510 [Planctobacterium marinum]|uniref:Uncharacterized protein n=2 Tax=Planctobacterium marinum TaxID=1631968 RepID=A0AA48I5K5_9ALTE|nr:hypothetical protein MACH26_18510 [Planctobacterium marinum]
MKLLAGFPQDEPFERGLFHGYGVDAWHKRLLYLGAVLLVFLSIELYFFEQSKVVMLPGTHPLISLLVLLYLAKHQQQFPAIYYIVPIILLVMEILTLYVLELSFWWGYLMAMLFAFLFPGRAR